MPRGFRQVWEILEEDSRRKTETNFVGRAIIINRVDVVGGAKVSQIWDHGRLEMMLTSVSWG